MPGAALATRYRVEEGRGKRRIQTAEHMGLFILELPIDMCMSRGCRRAGKHTGSLYVEMSSTSPNMSLYEDAWKNVQMQQNMAF